MGEHAKVFEGGKAVYKLLDGFGRPTRDVKTADWEMMMYVDYCLFPISDCIKRMINDVEAEREGPFYEYANILDRLYDAALSQLRKMDAAIYKDMGRIKIITTNEDIRGGFLHQAFLEVHVKEEPKRNGKGGADHE